MHPKTVADFLPLLLRSAKSFAAVSSMRGCPEYEHRYDAWSRLFHTHLADFEEKTLLFHDSVDPEATEGVADLAASLNSILSTAVADLFAPPKTTNPRIVAFIHKARTQCAEYVAELHKARKVIDLHVELQRVIDSIGESWAKLEEAATIMKERMSEVIGTAVTANNHIWIAKGKKGQVQGTDAQDALAKYIEQFGKRGELRLYSNKPEGGMLVFDSSCKSFKGSVSEVAHALVGVYASVEAEEVIAARFETGDRVIVDLGKRGKIAGTVVEHKQKNGGDSPHAAAWCYVRLEDGTEDRFPVTYVTTATICTARAEITPFEKLRVTQDTNDKSVYTGNIGFPEGDNVPFVLTVFGKGWVVRLRFGGDTYYVDIDGHEINYVTKPGNAQVFKSARDAYDTLVHAMHNASTAPEATAAVVTAADPIPDRVAGQILGDLKRIRSTVKSWKGKMPEPEYKEFVAYEKSVGDFIAKNFIPRMSKEQQAKAKGI